MVRCTDHEVTQYAVSPISLLLIPSYTHELMESCNVLRPIKYPIDCGDSNSFEMKKCLRDVYQVSRHGLNGCRKVVHETRLLRYQMERSDFVVNLFEQGRPTNNMAQRLLKIFVSIKFTKFLQRWRK